MLQKITFLKVLKVFITINYSENETVLVYNYT